MKFFFLLTFLCYFVSSSAQIDNNGFENWISYPSGSEYAPQPAHWSGNINLPWHRSAVRMVDGFMGAYAAGISYVVVNAVPKSGQLCYGSSDALGCPGLPYVFRPNLISGYYKAVIDKSDGDQAIGTVLLKKFNQQTGQSDTIAYGVINFDEQNSFKLFHIPMQYKSMASPDSISLKFSFLKAATTVPDTLGYLVIDQLISGGIESVDKLRSERFEIIQNYSDPYQIFINSKDQVVSGKIYDLTGKILHEVPITELQSGTFRIPNSVQGMAIVNICTSYHIFSQSIFLNI